MMENRKSAEKSRNVPERKKWGKSPKRKNVPMDHGKDRSMLNDQKL